MKIKAWKGFANKIDFLIYTEGLNQGVFSVILPVEMTAKVVKEGEDIKPTFSIFGPMASEFIKSMAEMAEEMGIKTDKQLKEENKIGGVLEALKYHLEDMRTLVFNKKK